ncbi:vWA domain-containing protein [Cytophaga sp. FL35]|uniref:vWA domain-containing protein n=1 Tax=Cytophaga sp. FL35 TaxID=1904456 RepID=UPI001653E25C|nr:vWA domain-containing protein [Cytophaga sp. FL35]MBC7000167.1 VWA domain-containing protein [Cytophaga sp. FL35]
MQIQTVLLILLAVIIALGIVLFQYFNVQKKRGQTGWVLSFLRFITIFGILLLLINPKLVKNQYTTEKANLILLLDESTSIANDSSFLKKSVNTFGNDDRISKRFNLHTYGFGKDLSSDSLKFAQNETNINKALESINEIFANSNAVTVLFSDGNQTVGQDFDYFKTGNQMSVFSVAVGDTTTYEDLAISQINANKFAFLNNQFPIEIFVDYSGDKAINAELSISVDGNTVKSQQLKLDGISNSKVVTNFIKASSIGLKNVVASVQELPSEKNTTNNKREVAVEVVDEKTNILLVSDMVHPDIAALKKAIESNEQRSVSLVSSSVSSEKMQNVDLFILYQPTPQFKPIYEFVEKSNTNVFTVTGSETDWDFINQAQNSFSKNSYDQTEEVSPVLNSGFTLFSLDDFSVDDYPPIESNLGEVVDFTESETLIGQTVKGVEIDEPLLTLYNEGKKRQAVFYGAGLWKWRMQTYRADKNFERFDEFIGKLVLFLASNKAKERLTLDYETVFEGSREAKIGASYFDNTFVFNADANLNISLKNADGKFKQEIPMLLKNKYYEADLSNLKPGKYDFTVSVKNENLSKSGSFTILDFDIEKQFLSTNYKKLQRLSERNNGNLYFPKELEALKDTLSNDQRLVPTQVSSQNIVSLIDFQILLVIIAISLAAEWFIRKYIGLI